MVRILDVVFLLYFLIHIPISVIIDIQAVLPSKYVPEQMIAIKQWYCNTFRDPLTADPPVWFQSVMLCELLFQWPFFFFAVYGYYKGAAKSKWLKVPAIMYGTHAVTGMIALLAHVLFADFSNTKHPAPRNIGERLSLAGTYSLFFIMPIIILLDACLSSAYAPLSAKTKNVKAQIQNGQKQSPSKKGQSKKKKTY